MTKRIIAMIIVVVLAAAMFTACGSEDKTVNDAKNTLSSTLEDLGSSLDNVTSSDDNSASSQNDTSSQSPGITVLDIPGTGTLPDGIAVEAVPFYYGYNYMSWYTGGDYDPYALMFLFTNNTGKNFSEFSVNISLLDSNGEEIETEYGYQKKECVANGTTICVQFTSPVPFSSFKYEVSTLEMKEGSRWATVDQDLSADVSREDDYLIVSLINNGTIPAKDVSYSALFYKNGRLVYKDGYDCFDEDREIKPGKTETSQFNVSSAPEYDDVKIYCHGKGLAS